MAPNRTPRPEVPCTPYSRPKQFDTARRLFKKMCEDQHKTPIPQPKFAFSPTPARKSMPHSPPLTPEDEDTPMLGARSAAAAAPTPGTGTAARAPPCTPPPTLPRGPSTECPKLMRAKRNLLYVIPPAPGASSDPIELETDESLGSPIRLAPVPFRMSATPRIVVTTPRKATSTSAAAPWAPKRPSFKQASAYHLARKAIRPLDLSGTGICSSSSTRSSSACTTPTKSLDRQDLVGRINHLENLVRSLRRELATQKAAPDATLLSTPTKASSTPRRALQYSRQRPIRADSVFL